MPKRISLNSLFLYLADATLCINDEAKDNVWRDMASTLVERGVAKRDEIRYIFRKNDMHYEEFCVKCNNPLPDEGYTGDPLCEDCEKKIPMTKCNDCKNNIPDIITEKVKETIDSVLRCGVCQLTWENARDEFTERCRNAC